MTHDLTVESGDSYRVDAGVHETHARTSVVGTLEVAGTLELTGEEARTVRPPTGIDLPLAINLRDMNMGIAVFLIGSLGTTLSAAWLLKNYAALIMWGFAFIALLIGGIMGMGLEIFWMALIAVVLLLMVGGVVRWAAA